MTRNARNVIIFVVENSPSSHTDSCKNNFFILGEVINRSFGSPGKKFNINFSKANKKFCLSLHCNADSSYLFVNEKEVSKFEASNKNLIIPTQFCLGSIPNVFSTTESREVS